MAKLLAEPAFRRFLWRLIERGGLFVTATSGADDRDLNFAEGRRSVTLEILTECEHFQEEQHPSGLPLLALIQTLREEVQTPQHLLEKPRGRRSRNDQYRDLRDRSDGRDDDE
jgi:hypothetical protein